MKRDKVFKPLLPLLTSSQHADVCDKLTDGADGNVPVPLFLQAKVQTQPYLMHPRAHPGNLYHARKHPNVRALTCAAVRASASARERFLLKHHSIVTFTPNTSLNSLFLMQMRLEKRVNASTAASLEMLRKKKPNDQISQV